MNRSLPVRERMLPEESLTSLVRRYVTAMGYEGFPRVLGQAEGLRFPKHLETLGREPPLEWLAAFLRQHVEELLRATIHSVDEITVNAPGADRSRGNGSLPTIDRYFDFGKRRVCPACLQEDVPYERLSWSFRPLVVCPEHGVPLVDRCPACRHGLLPRRLDVARCPCGTELSNPTASTSGPEAQKLAKLEYGWLTKARPPPFGLSRGALFSWQESLAQAVAAAPDFRRQVRLELGLPESLGDESVAWLVAARLLQPRPGELDEFLDELQNVARPASPSTRTGRALRRLQRDADRLERLGYAAPADTLRRYLLKRYTRGHLSATGVLFRKDVHRRSLAKRPWISQTEAGRLLSLRPPSVAALVRRNVLEGRIERSGPRGRTNGVVRRQAVERYAVRLSSAVSVKQAARRLGIDQPRVCDLIRADLLPDAVLCHGGWRIPADAVEELLRRVRQRSAITAGRDNLLSLRETLRRLGVRGWNIAKLLTAVLSGQVTPWRRRDTDRLAELFFERSDVERLKTTVSSGSEPSGYPLSGVATQLILGRRVGPRCLRKWIGAGLLSAERRRKAWWITAEEAKRFRETYCTARDVCRQLGVARSTLDLWEARGRLIAAYGRRGNSAAGLSLFLRTDVERLAAARAARSAS